MGRDVGQDVYRRLQDKLDRVSFGLPETGSGLEIKLLKKLFSEKDAEIFLKLSFLLESTKKIAAKIGLSEEEAAVVLEDMANRGLLYSLRRGGKTYYAAIPFVHGLFEFQVQRIDKEFAELAFEYFYGEWSPRLGENVKDFLRVIPVNQTVVSDSTIAPFEDAVRILESKDNIVVANCICHKGSELAAGKECDKPLEVCFMFGSMGQYYLDRKLGRKIELDEALKILKEAQDAGLVCSPASAINPVGMCNCCPDCCGYLGPISKMPKPAEVVFSNYLAQVNREECVGCSACVHRCPMNAITMDVEEKASIDLDRCIGCGLCALKCKTGALSLKGKDVKDRMVPVKNGELQMLKIARNRGTIGKFLGHEIISAYRHHHVFGVISLIARLLVKTGQKMLGK